MPNWARSATCGGGERPRGGLAGRGRAYCTCASRRTTTTTGGPITTVCLAFHLPTDVEHTGLNTRGTASARDTLDRASLLALRKLYPIYVAALDNPVFSCPVSVQAPAVGQALDGAGPSLYLDRCSTGIVQSLYRSSAWTGARQALDRQWTKLDFLSRICPTDHRLGAPRIFTVRGRSSTCESFPR